MKFLVELENDNVQAFNTRDATISIKTHDEEMMDTLHDRQLQHTEQLKQVPSLDIHDVQQGESRDYTILKKMVGTGPQGMT